MDREIYLIKDNPRRSYKATGFGLTLASRLRLYPADKMSCGTQPANIRLANRRVKFPFSFHHYFYKFVIKKRRRKERYLIDREAHHIRSLSGLYSLIKRARSISSLLIVINTSLAMAICFLPHRL
jgi:hypothetical protein